MHIQQTPLIAPSSYRMKSEFFTNCSANFLSSDLHHISYIILEITCVFQRFSNNAIYFHFMLFPLPPHCLYLVVKPHSLFKIQLKFDFFLCQNFSNHSIISDPKTFCLYPRFASVNFNI